MSLARKYRIVPTSSPWVSGDDQSQAVFEIAYPGDDSERALRNPLEGGHRETTSDDEIRCRPRLPSYCKPVISILDIQTRSGSDKKNTFVEKFFEIVK